MDPVKACPQVGNSAFSLAQDEEEQSPLKQPRVETCSHEKMPKDVGVGDYADDDDDDDDDTLGRKFTPEERAKYLQQIQDSEGFDVDYFPGVFEMGVISPVLYFKKDPLWYNDSRQWSILALEEYNKEHNTSYEFDDVVKLNVRGSGGFECWVTFRAQDAAESQTFQAEVYAGINEVVIENVRLKKSPNF